MKPMTEVRCLMNTKFKPSIQNGVARCDKTLNQYVTKNGNQIREVLCDFGNHLAHLLVSTYQCKSLKDYGKRIKSVEY